MVVCVVLSLAIYAVMGRGGVIYHQAYVSANDAYKLSQILNQPELLKTSLMKDLKLNPNDEKKQSLLASVCMHVKDYTCAKQHYVWLVKNHPKDVYFIHYLKSQMKLNKNQLSQQDRKLMGMYLSRHFENMEVHRIAAQDAMAHQEYSKAAAHWRYVLDHLDQAAPDRMLLEKSHALAVKNMRKS
ncbi:MAG TPA: hypothetical protein QF353_01245 [Gammaproteobacteria bacterium]|nr:hypothetical protein [Gammaproteobacteria bacterium]